MAGDSDLVADDTACGLGACETDSQRGLDAGASKLRWSIPLLVSAALILGGVSVYYLTGAGETVTAMQDRLRALPALGMFGIAIFGLITVAGNVGRRNVVRIAALTAAGLLLLYGVNSAVQVVYLHPDAPVEPLIYTQTSPDVPIIVEEIRRASINQTATIEVRKIPQVA